MQKILIASIAVLMVGCNTTPTREVVATSESAPARIEIQEAVGFTIVEDSQIEGAVRLDYDRAQDLLAQGRLEDGIELLEKVAEAAPTLSAPRIDLGIA